MVHRTRPKSKPTTRYRWPAYLSEEMRDALKLFLLGKKISFSEWVRRHAERDLKKD